MANLREIHAWVQIVAPSPQSFLEQGSRTLMALADTAMVLACSAAWNGYRPMMSIDQTTHFLRPVNFDVVAALDN